MTNDGESADAMGAAKISPKHILFSEISLVTSMMRKNSRWATSTSSFTGRDLTMTAGLGLRVSSPNSAPHTYARGSPERDLMAGFQMLRRLVGDADDIFTIPLPTILSPFFAIIRSPLSTGPITSATLSALQSLFMSGIISPASPNLGAALAEFSTVVSNCKFEATSSSGDEAVMLKIVTVIESCICGPAGANLGDVEVCEMLETVLTTCCQMRLSEILRRSAELTLHSIVRVMFARLLHLDPSMEEEKLQSVKMTAPTEVTPAEIDQTESNQSDITGDTQVDEHEEAVPAISTNDTRTSKPEMADVTSKPPPYGIPAMVELIRVLVNILDPNEKVHTDSTRLVSMRTLNSAFEVSGGRLGNFESLSSIILDHGCKYLFQLARSDNPSVLQLALRTICTIFETMREHLKFQQELFLAFTIDRLTPPTPINLPRSGLLSPRPGTPASFSSTAATPESKTPLTSDSPAPSKPNILPARGETRELILDTLTQLSNHPSFMVDLYTNYDCDINSENLFSRLIEFLTQGVYPNVAPGTIEPPLQNSQYLCLDMLLAFVNNMTRRAEGKAEPWPTSAIPVEELQSSKSRKNLVTIGAAKFNEKPKAGLAFFEENGLIYSDLSPEVSRTLSLARFLKSSSRFDKRLLGDYISKPENIELLKEFIGLFDFKGKSVAEAMREMLETFRLPGEAQQIGRITEAFAEYYFASEPGEIKGQDAVYVLAYSIILLNTDLHNPQVRKRMTIEDYRKNLKGVNEGSDFSSEFLQDIYDSIRKREIVMPQEQSGQLGFDFAWKELLSRSRQSSNLIICNSAVFDVDMFKAVWTPVISAVAYAFMTFDDDYIIERAITGFRQCATLAGHFQLPDVFDYVVVTLSQTTSLLPLSLPTQVPNYPTVDVDGQSVTVSSLSVRFGANIKGQLAAVVLFNIVNGNGNALREGWMQIFEMFQNLFMHALLPTRMLQMEDFLGGVSIIPLRGNQPTRPQPRHEGGGLLSALSSYLMTPYGASSESIVPDATESDIQNTLSTIDCIAACRLDELYAQIIQLDVEALMAAIRALEALARGRTIDRLKHSIDEGTGFQAPTDNGALPYDPASVFLLETMVSIACQTTRYIEKLWPLLFDYLSALLSSPTRFSILLIERSVVALLRLCRLIANEPTLRDQVYVSLDLLSGLPSSLAASLAEQIIQGLLLIVQEHRDIIRSQTEWNVVFAVIRSTMSNPEAGALSFAMISQMVTEASEEAVTADNFFGIITVLDDFAGLAGFIVETQRQSRRREPPLTSATSPIVDRGHKAVDLLFEVKKFMPRFIENLGLSIEQGWRQFRLPLLSSLARQSTNASLEVRHTSIVHLQRVLLGSSISSTPALLEQRLVEELFNRVVFPLIDDLLKPQVFQRDQQGMRETRLRASALLCKAFMHFEVHESRAQTDIRVLWIQVLDLLDRLMNVDKQDQLYEAVPESLKNIVLVMHAADILVPPVTAKERSNQQQALWDATHERIERFLPGFLAAVVPTSPPSPEERASTPASQPT